MGRASPMGSGPPCSSPRGSDAPIENSPPGIQTIPLGGGPAGTVSAGTVAANAGSIRDSVAVVMGLATGSNTCPARSIQAVPPAASIKRMAAGRLWRAGRDGFRSVLMASLGRRGCRILPREVHHQRQGRLGIYLLQSDGHREAQGG